MNLVGAILADGGEERLPPIQAAGYEYVLGGNGLFIRAENNMMAAMVPVAWVRLYGLGDLTPYALLKVEKIPMGLLWGVLKDARRVLPAEGMYQFCRAARDGWTCVKPRQAARPGAVRFDDVGEALVDLHSHGDLPAFFSQTDDGDEQGLRFYAVIGKVGSDRPQISVRVGVYGHHWPVSVGAIFGGVR